MINALKNEANKTRTENGAVTLRSSMDYCVDLFATIGALRRASDTEITNRFIRAYTENPDLAMKILFFARDIRGGLGERRVFRTILKWLAENKTSSAKRNIKYIAEYGRYDDLLVLLGTPCESEAFGYIAKTLKNDVGAMNENKEVTLLAKWLPSVNASNAETVKQAKYLAKRLGMEQAEYRKTLSALRAYIKIIENNLREKDYTFDYEKQPSKALFKYRQAFINNDGKRYKEFLNRVNSGEAKMNTGTLAPYELIRPICELDYNWRYKPVTQEQIDVINTTWSALARPVDYENSLAIIDTSGSMYWQGNPLPASVALSLGIYFAENNKGVFANHFIEFSENPQLIEIKGETFVDKVRFIETFNEVGNTNIEKVFELIYVAAVDNNVPQEELPKTLYIISDMEFDHCTNGAQLTNFEYAKKLFESAGYTLPNVVFWNVQSRNTQEPVKKNDQGVALVSGCTPKLFDMVMSGELDPYTFMLEAVCTERYERIAA